MIPPSIETALRMELFTAIMLVHKNPDTLDHNCVRMIRMIESVMKKHENDCDEEKIMDAARMLMQSCPVTEAEAEVFLRRMGELGSGEKKAG